MMATVTAAAAPPEVAAMGTVSLHIMAVTMAAMTAEAIAAVRVVQALVVAAAAVINLLH